MPPLYSATDTDREKDVVKGGVAEEYRSNWRRDYARLIHSAAFRRLQGKTQVFPGHEGDFFRNRLTHSLEVAQIAKSIAIRLNDQEPLFGGDSQILPELPEFAGLAHDLGHPPFGHNGEEALDECMRNHGGFEGNAQTLRILAKLEKKSTRSDPEDFKPFTADGVDNRLGLNLAYRTLASILKYDNPIPERRLDRPESKRDKVMKGYYASEAELVSNIKEAVLGKANGKKLKTVECSIMDVADDIAYSTYDLEDVFKSGFLKPLELFTLDTKVYEEVIKTINSRLADQYPEENRVIGEEDVHQILFSVLAMLFEVHETQRVFISDTEIPAEAKKRYIAAEVQKISQVLAADGYYRTDLTSNLIQYVLQEIEVIEDKEFPQLHKVRLKVDTFIRVEVLKNITFEAVIRSPALQVVEFRGKEIVKKIFMALVEDGGYRLLPHDLQIAYKAGGEVNRYRAVCDFVAGMTDRYAIEFYDRLFGSNPLSMHKPL